MKPKNIFLKILFYSLAVLFWLLLWWCIAAKIDQPLLLPTPLSVLKRLSELAVTSEFWRITALSLTRILYGILLSIAIGIPLAILTARLPFFRILFRPLMTAIRSTPVAAFIVLVWLMIGGDMVPTIITVLIGLPVVWKNVETGILGIDRSLLEMAKTFRVPLWKRIPMLDLPSVLPSFQAALQTTVGLGWKAGIAAEILIRPTQSIGTKISNAKLDLETTDLFAWTLTVILLSLVIEFLFSALLSRIFPKAPSQNEKKEDTV